MAVSPDGETAVRGQCRQQLRGGGRYRGARTAARCKASFPPVGIPTAVAVTPDGKRLLVGVGKGNQTPANPDSQTASPRTDEPATRGRRYPYIGTTLSGALSIVPIPDGTQLAAYTETVYRNCPYSDKLLSAVPHPRKTAIPTKVGEPSPIKHVIYIIKENRTYDQVFGDIGRGNCDPALVMFGAGRDAQSSQAGQRVCVVGQPVLQRPRFGRRSSLVDDGLQHRLHGAQLGSDLFRVARASRTTTKVICKRPPRAICGIPAPATTSAIAATANTAVA